MEINLMTSFQITISPSRRVAGRFISDVRRKLQRALSEESAKSGLTQSDIARSIGVHRSVINRELKGFKDITLGRLAELAFAMGREPTLELLLDQDEVGTNAPSISVAPVLPNTAVNSMQAKLTKSSSLNSNVVSGQFVMEAA
jgi:transcriptional regulator with XRE-family HTH domain